MRQKRNRSEFISIILILLSLVFNTQVFAMSGASSANTSSEQMAMQMDANGEQMNIMDCDTVCPDCFSCTFAIPVLPISLAIAEKEDLLLVQDILAISYSPFQLFRPPR